MFNNRGRRRKFRSNNKPFRRRHNGDGHINKSPNSFTGDQFRVRSIKGPHNIQKLIEKYNNLAKEALSSGDKILSENYLQHADHFSRMSATNNLPRDENKVIEFGKEPNLNETKNIDKDQKIQPENNSPEKIEKK